LSRHSTDGAGLRAAPWAARIPSGCGWPRGDVGEQQLADLQSLHSSTDGEFSPQQINPSSKLTLQVGLGGCGTGGAFLPG